MQMEVVDVVELFRRHQKNENHILWKGRRTEILNKNVFLGKRMYILYIHYNIYNHGYI